MPISSTPQGPPHPCLRRSTHMRLTTLGFLQSSVLHYQWNTRVNHLHHHRKHASRCFPHMSRTRSNAYDSCTTALQFYWYSELAVMKAQLHSVVQMQDHLHGKTLLMQVILNSMRSIVSRVWLLFFLSLKEENVCYRCKWVLWCKNEFVRTRMLWICFYLMIVNAFFIKGKCVAYGEMVHFIYHSQGKGMTNAAM